MNLSKYRSILFDVGETLLTKEPSDAEVLADRLSMAGINIDLSRAVSACKKCELWIGEQVYKEIHGASRMSDQDFNLNLDRVAVKKLFPDLSETEIRAATERLLHTHRKKQHWKIKNDIHPTLEALKSRGFLLGIVSNFNNTLPKLLENLDLTHYFENITVSSIVQLEKPDPEILLLACRSLNVKPSQCLYVGDHPFDILCAKKAGLDIAWICSNEDRLPDYIPYKEDFRIRSLLQLII